MKSSSDLITHFFFPLVPHLAGVIDPHGKCQVVEEKASLPAEQSLRLLHYICGLEKDCLYLVKLLLSKGK